jgi:hypothetical protein
MQMDYRNAHPPMPSQVKTNNRNLTGLFKKQALYQFSNFGNLL